MDRVDKWMADNGVSPTSTVLDLYEDPAKNQYLIGIPLYDGDVAPDDSVLSLFVVAEDGDPVAVKVGQVRELATLVDGWIARNFGESVSTQKRLQILDAVVSVNFFHLGIEGEDLEVNTARTVVQEKTLALLDEKIATAIEPLRPRLARLRSVVSLSAFSREILDTYGLGVQQRFGRPELAKPILDLYVSASLSSDSGTALEEALVASFQQDQQRAGAEEVTERLGG